VKITRHAEEDTVYSYPYRTFPLLESHLHPKFAIFNAGMKISKILRERSSLQLFDDYPSLDNIWKLYNIWSQPPPMFSKDDKSYINSDPVLVYESGDSPGDDLSDDDYADRYDNRIRSGRGEEYLPPRTRSITAAERDDNFDDDNRANRTKRRRGDGFHPVVRDGNGGDRYDKRIRSGDEYLPPRTRSITAAERANLAKSGHREYKPRKIAKRKAPKRKEPKRKVLSESSNRNPHLLSEATLYRLNRENGEVSWTGDRINRWSNTFEKRRLISTLSF